MQEKRFNAWAEFKAVDTAKDGYTYIEGYASTTALDRDQEMIDPKAYANCMEEYSLNPVILSNHINTVENVVGKMVDYKIESNALWVKVQLSNSQDEHTKMIVSKVKEGLLRAFSIGGLFKYVGSKITEIKLLEISIVPIPSNPFSLFSMAKAFKMAMEEDQPEPEVVEAEEVEEVVEEVIEQETTENEDTKAVSEDAGGAGNELANVTAQEEDSFFDVHKYHKSLTQIYLERKGLIPNE